MPQFKDKKVFVPYKNLYIIGRPILEQWYSKVRYQKQTMHIFLIYQYLVQDNENCSKIALSILEESCSKIRHQ